MKINTKKWRDKISRHPDEVEKEYDSISHHYDNELTVKGYLAPKHASKLVKSYITDIDSPILDAGCGTGLFGQELHKEGFSNITGIDISSNCLELAEKKGIYVKNQKQDLLKTFSFVDNSFRCVACVGVFSRFDETQIQQIVSEYMRVIQINGFIFFSHRDDLITPLLKQSLNKIQGLKFEQLTEPLTYFSEDEHYKDINIRFFVFRKTI